MLYFGRLGSHVMGLLHDLGQAGVLLIAMLGKRMPLRLELSLLMQQIYYSGVLSLLIIMVSAIFIGMVLAMQGYHTLNKFGALSQLGPLVGLSISRELGPVVAAILFAGRAGSAITAEIALMQATEQLAGMEMLAVDPVVRILRPRFLGGCVTLPLLTIIFDAVAILGSYFIAVQCLGLDHGIFWSNMQDSIEFYNDIVNGLLKSLVFGVVVTWVAVYQGYYGQPTAAGVANSTTKTVVYGSLLILALDFILTIAMISGW